MYDTDNASTKVKPDNEIPFGASACQRLWGLGARPHNFLGKNARNVAQFNVVETGLTECVDNLTKPVAESGEVMSVIDGPSVHDAAQRVRYVCFLAGVCYTPNLVMCEFENSDDACDATLQLPIGVSHLLQAKTGLKLVYHCLRVDLRRARGRFDKQLGGDALVHRTYDALDRDGNSMWSCITGLQPRGFLWAPSMPKPLGEAGIDKKLAAARAAQANLDKLSTSDPLEAETVAQTRAPRTRRTMAPRRAPEQSRANNVGGGGTPLLRGSPPDAIGRNVAGATGAAQDAVPEPEPPTSARQDPGNDLDVEKDMDLAEALGDIWSDDDNSASEEQESPGLATPGDAEDAQALAEAAADPGAIPTPALEAEMAKALLDIEDDTPPRQSRRGPRRRGAWRTSYVRGHIFELGLEAMGPCTTPSSIGGYVYADGRSIMRIQRGKPAGRCTVTCYRHPACNFLLNLDKTPPDEELFAWLFAMPPAPTDMPRHERS